MTLDLVKRLEDKIRKASNEDIIARMKKGEILNRFDSTSSWFPPRPIIEKDKEAIRKLHSISNSNKEERTKQNRLKLQK